MAAAADCKKLFDANVSNITANYNNKVINITTAKILYQRELTNLQKCSGNDMSVSSIVNPFETVVINYKFVNPLIVKQGVVKTFFKVGDIVKGDRMPNGNVQINVNGQNVEVDKSYIEETPDTVTIVTSETEREIKRMNPTYNTLEKVAMGFLVVFGVLVFIKLLKII